jgi:DNA-binding NarL/FixJ family response regulator
MQHMNAECSLPPEFLDAGLAEDGTPAFSGIPGIKSSRLDDPAPHAMTIGIIDGYRFSQECLVKALENLQPQPTVYAFSSVDDCIAEGRSDLDLIIYYSHVHAASDIAPTNVAAAVGQAFPSVPLVIMSDADDAQQMKVIRSTLQSGAHGFIPTRTTGIPIAIAAIRLVRAGGIFAPMDAMLVNRPERTQAAPDSVRPCHITARQMAVLMHMQRGNANKIIAHELGMSESTVKVHVRNIMRKLGATNRTQAVYKARRLLEAAVPARAAI